MMKKIPIFLVFSLVLLSTLPVARADVGVPQVTAQFPDAIVLLAFVIGIEIVAGHLLLKKYYNLQLAFSDSVIIFALTNILSAIIGYLLLLYQNGGFGFPPFISFLELQAKGGQSPYEKLSSITLMFTLTCVIETPLIYLGIRKKTERGGLKESLAASILTNVLSYIFLTVTILNTELEMVIEKMTRGGKAP